MMKNKDSAKAMATSDTAMWSFDIMSLKENMSVTREYISSQYNPPLFQALHLIKWLNNFINLPPLIAGTTSSWVMGEGHVGKSVDKRGWLQCLREGNTKIFSHTCP